MPRFARPQAVATTDTTRGSAETTVVVSDRYRWIALSNTVLAG